MEYFIRRNERFYGEQHMLLTAVKKMLLYLELEMLQLLELLKRKEIIYM